MVARIEIPEPISAAGQAGLVVSTMMLASVLSPEEAEQAIIGGADIIDMKDPKAGALGALSPEIVRRTVLAIAGRRPTSAVTGDLPMLPDEICAAVGAMADTGVDYVKIGLFDAPGRAACIESLRPWAGRVKLIGVLFADQGIPLEPVDLMGDCGFAGVILDTAAKGQGRLLDYAPLGALRGFVSQARRNGLLVGLAGSIEAPDIPRLLPLRPDVLGFRGALCGAGNRKAGLDPGRVQQIAALVHDRPVSGREQSVTATALDRIYVENMVVAMPIGAYRHEEGRAQRVRFDVVVEIRPRDRHADDMVDVFSYDIVTDAITELASSPHVTLVETLAEALAERILAEPSTVRTHVKVTKLDVGPGAVGIEITREAGRG